MTPDIQTAHLTLRFGDVVAIDDLTVSIPPYRITGLFGRNGAGKSTLMRMLAGYRRTTSGSLLIGGRQPFEDPELMAETVLVRDKIANGDTTSVNDHLSIAASLRPRWDRDFAESLLDRFEIPRRRKSIAKLSQGQRAALNVVVALASRAPLTMFDEPHLGMDAPSRYAFYDALIADYMAHPRTIVISTHIIGEVANLVEDVLIIDRGRLVVHEQADRLRTMGAEVTGPATRVDEITAGRRVLSSRSLGNTKSVVVYDEPGSNFARLATDRDLDVGPLPLQDLFVHLTETRSPEPQEVSS
jgi:ABC-2 type transport system ATP-binding protein